MGQTELLEHGHLSSNYWGSRTLLGTMDLMEQWADYAGGIPLQVDYTSGDYTGTGAGRRVSPRHGTRKSTYMLQ